MAGRSRTKILDMVLKATDKFSGTFKASQRSVNLVDKASKAYKMTLEELEQKTEELKRSTKGYNDAISGGAEAVGGRSGFKKLNEDMDQSLERVHKLILQLAKLRTILEQSGVSGEALQIIKADQTSTRKSAQQAALEASAARAGATQRVTGKLPGISPTEAAAQLKALEALRKAGDLTDNQFIRLSATIRARLIPAATGLRGVINSLRRAMIQKGATVTVLTQGLGQFNLKADQMRGRTTGLRRAIGRLRNSLLLASFALGSVVATLGQTIVNATTLEAALTGLNSVAKNTQNAMILSRDAAIDLTKDGLLNVQQASESLKNLLSAGFGLDQAKNLMMALTDAAAFGRQGTLSFGEAVVGATQGIKNQNSIMVDNAGITKNLSVLYREYANQIGTTEGSLTEAQKRQAIYNGVLREAAVFSGDAKKATETLQGQISKFKVNLFDISATIGQEFSPEIKKLLAWVNDIIKGTKEWIQANKGWIRTEVAVAIHAAVDTARLFGKALSFIVEKFEGLNPRLQEAIIFLSKMVVIFVSLKALLPVLAKLAAGLLSIVSFLVPGGVAGKGLAALLGTVAKQALKLAAVSAVIAGIVEAMDRWIFAEARLKAEQDEAIKTSEERFNKAREAISRTGEAANSVKDLVKIYNGVLKSIQKLNDTDAGIEAYNDKIKELKSLEKQLIELSPKFKEVFDETGGGIEASSAAAEKALSDLSDVVDQNFKLMVDRANELTAEGSKAGALMLSELYGLTRTNLKKMNDEFDRANLFNASENFDRRVVVTVGYRLWEPGGNGSIVSQNEIKAKLSELPKVIAGIQATNNKEGIQIEVKIKPQFDVEFWEAQLKAFEDATKSRGMGEFLSSILLSGTPESRKLALRIFDEGINTRFRLFKENQEAMMELVEKYGIEEERIKQNFYLGSRLEREALLEKSLQDEAKLKIIAETELQERLNKIIFEAEKDRIEKVAQIKAGGNVPVFRATFGALNANIGNGSGSEQAYVSELNSLYEEAYRKRAGWAADFFFQEVRLIAATSSASDIARRAEQTGQAEAYRRALTEHQSFLQEKIDLDEGVWQARKELTISRELNLDKEIFQEKLGLYQQFLAQSYKYREIELAGEAMYNQVDYEAAKAHADRMIELSRYSTDARIRHAGEAAQMIVATQANISKLTENLVVSSFGRLFSARQKDSKRIEELQKATTEFEREQINQRYEKERKNAKGTISLQGAVAKSAAIFAAKEVNDWIEVKKKQWELQAAQHAAAAIGALFTNPAAAATEALASAKFAALSGAATGAQAIISARVDKAQGKIDNILSDNLNSTDSASTTSGAGSRVGGSIQAKELSITIAPTVSISGETIVVGGNGTVQDLETSLAQVTLNTLRQAIETNELDLGRVVN